jgi:hypothetical protein
MLYVVHSSNTLYHVHYCPVTLSQLKSAFVSYVSSEEEFAKSGLEVPGEESSDNLCSKDELTLRENMLHFEDEIEGFDRKDNFVLLYFSHDLSKLGFHFHFAPSFKMSYLAQFLANSPEI